MLRPVAILATFLTGIALGSFIYARFLSKVADQLSLFLGIEMCIGVLSYATPFVFQALHGPLFNKLSEALTKVIGGYIPICAHCKKIRDEENSWTPVDEFVRSRSEAEFSHTICTDCARRYYGDFVDV